MLSRCDEPSRNGGVGSGISQQSYASSLFLSGSTHENFVRAKISRKSVCRHKTFFPLFFMGDRRGIENYSLKQNFVVVDFFRAGFDCTLKKGFLFKDRGGGRV